MRKGSSDHVRRVAEREYVKRSNASGTLRIPLGEIQRTLLKEGFPAGHLRQIRTSLESAFFWKSLGLRLVSAKGQPDRVGTVLEFASADGFTDRKAMSRRADPLLELRGVLRGAIQEGAAAFLTELRRDRGPRKDTSKRAEHAA